MFWLRGFDRGDEGVVAMAVQHLAWKMEDALDDGDGSFKILIDLTIMS